MSAAPRFECVFGALSVPRVAHLPAQDLAAEIERALTALLVEAPLPSVHASGAPLEVPGGVITVPAGADRLTVAHAVARHIHEHLSEGAIRP